MLEEKNEQFQKLTVEKGQCNKKLNSNKTKKNAIKHFPCIDKLLLKEEGRSLFYFFSSHKKESEKKKKRL